MLLSLPRLHTDGHAAHRWLRAPLLQPPAAGCPLLQEEVGYILHPASPQGTLHCLVKAWHLFGCSLGTEGCNSLCSRGKKVGSGGHRVAQNLHPHLALPLAGSRQQS